MFFSKLTKPEVQNSCQKYYKGVVGQRRGNNRLQNSPYFCVFKYALAVKQKERVTDFFTVLKNKTTVLQSMAIKEYAESRA